MSEIKKVVAKKPQLPLLPIAVFLLVIIVTAGLFAYTQMQKSEIEEIQTQISKFDTAIDSLRADSAIQVKQLIKNNKASLDLLKKRSQVTTYIKHLEEIGGPTIDFNGFDLKDGVVRTEAEVKSMKGKLAYKTVEQFIKDYRETVAKDEVFDLEFINNFEGNDTISFETAFLIK